MKRYNYILILSMFFVALTSVSAQFDDLYFDPSKDVVAASVRSYEYTSDDYDRASYNDEYTDNREEAYEYSSYSSRINRFRRARSYDEWLWRQGWTSYPSYGASSYWTQPSRGVNVVFSFGNAGNYSAYGNRYWNRSYYNRYNGYGDYGYSSPWNAGNVYYGNTYYGNTYYGASNPYCNPAYNNRANRTTVTNNRNVYNGSRATRTNPSRQNRNSQALRRTGDSNPRAARISNSSRTNERAVRRESNRSRSRARSDRSNRSFRSTTPSPSRRVSTSRSRSSFRATTPSFNTNRSSSKPSSRSSSRRGRG